MIQTMLGVAVLLFSSGPSLAPVVPVVQEVEARPEKALTYELPAFAQLGQGSLRDWIARYFTDLGSLRRFHDVELSPSRRARLRQFTQAWREGLEAFDFERLEAGERIDYLLFDNRLRYELRRLELDDVRLSESRPLLPFLDAVVELQEARRRLVPLDAPAAAAKLVALRTELEELRARVRPEGQEASDASEAANEATDAQAELLRVPRTLAHRVSREVQSLRAALGSWFRYYDGYDPLATWWLREPYAALDGALSDYEAFLRTEVAGADDADAIIGDPIGREALLADLQNELIVYTPEELLEIARREFEWCEREMRRAASELGFGEDWLVALEHVKTLHVQPGEQPELIRSLALEAVDFLEERDLLTIPALAKQVWRMEMMSPERQKVTPFFTGGEVISVSFPTDSMEHADKLMSLRGNNRHFSRATVHHELIPGHHLQQFMNARYETQRRMFGTPFWGEGWALYWELLLWDLEFQRSPEDRVGMLFWRSHRCARILFSLGFHLGSMTPEECIELLVERVGHERANATAEVRRSFGGSYSPLYQCAYMLGGLQFRALRRELVESGRMTDREFHDAILRENSIPVELVRAKLTGAELERDFRPSWRFYGDVKVR